MLRDLSIIVAAPPEESQDPVTRTWLKGLRKDLAALPRIPEIVFRAEATHAEAWRAGVLAATRSLLWFVTPGLRVTREDLSRTALALARDPLGPHRFGETADGSRRWLARWRGWWGFTSDPDAGVCVARGIAEHACEGAEWPESPTELALRFRYVRENRRRIEPGVAVRVRTPGRSPLIPKLAAQQSETVAREAYIAAIDSVYCLLNSVTAKDEIARYWAVEDDPGPNDPRWSSLPNLRADIPGLADDERLLSTYHGLLATHAIAVVIDPLYPQLSPKDVEDAVLALKREPFAFVRDRDGGIALLAGTQPLSASDLRETSRRGVTLRTRERLASVDSAPGLERELREGARHRLYPDEQARALEHLLGILKVPGPSES